MVRKLVRRDDDDETPLPKMPRLSDSVSPVPVPECKPPSMDEPPSRPGMWLDTKDPSRLVGQDVVVRENMSKGRERRLAYVTAFESNRIQVQWYWVKDESRLPPFNEHPEGCVERKADREVILGTAWDWVPVSEVVPLVVNVCTPSEQWYSYSCEIMTKPGRFSDGHTDDKPRLMGALEGRPRETYVQEKSEGDDFFWATPVVREQEGRWFYNGVCVRNVDFWVGCTVRFVDGAEAIGTIVSLSQSREGSSTVELDLLEEVRDQLKDVKEKVWVSPSQLRQKVWLVDQPGSHAHADDLSSKYLESRVQRTIFYSPVK